jgi:hypothetical protein
MTPPASPASSPDDTPKAAVPPTSWPDLLQASQEPVALGLRMIHDVPVELETVTPPWFPSGSFAGPTDTLAMATIVVGPAECAESIHLLVPLVPRILGDFAEGINDTNRVQAVKLLSFFSTVQCSGAQLSPVRGALPRTVFGAEREWPTKLVEHLPSLSLRERQTLAFAALAVGDLELVPTFLGGDPLPAEFVPDPSVDVHPHVFLPYLATAVRDIAPRADVEAAWLRVVESFPQQLASGTMDWAELLYSARIFLTRFRGDSLSTVTNTMHKLVSS